MNDPGVSGVVGEPGLRLKKLWYLIAVLMLAAVTVISLVPAPDVGVGDKLSHVLTYFVLAGWYGLLAANRSVLGWSLLGLFAYGAVIELLQGMTSYRYAEWGDLAANGIGILLGAGLYFSPLTRLLRIVDSRLARICQR